MDAWAGAASGGSFRAVAPVSILGLGFLVLESLVDYGNAPDNVWAAVIYLNHFTGPVDAHVTTKYPLQSPKYSQGGQELNASAGAC